jgi:hypothetical protein
MAQNFLISSRHGTVFYYRRRVPNDLRQILGKDYLLKTLETSQRGAAIALARCFATRTDALYAGLRAMKKSKADSGKFDYTVQVDFDLFGKPSSITFDAQPGEEESVNSAIRAAMGAAGGAIGSDPPKGKPIKSFEMAISEYLQKASGKPQTKATYRSKFAHVQEFFGGKDADILAIDQVQFVKYTEHVTATLDNITTQGHYISTVAGFLNWHRTRSADLTQLTTKTLMPKKETPESDERDAFTLTELGDIFRNASQYRRLNPCKFWATVAPAFLGCRIEELCQIQLKTDLQRDEDADLWYLILDGKVDLDGVLRKSIKKLTSWRRVPIHPTLVKHGFVDFLKNQEAEGHLRPFLAEWKPRETKSVAGQIIKWSQYVSKWGGRELVAVRSKYEFDPTHDTSYFHSMRHTFKAVLGDAGVSSEISEALSGRRYGGADAERYEKLKQNHRRLSKEGIEPGLDQITKLLDDVLGAS